MYRPLLILATFLLALPGLSVAGCGGEDSGPDPHQVMSRAFEPESVKAALREAVIRVQSLDSGNRVLNERVLEVPEPLVDRLGDTLGRSRGGFGLLTRGLTYRGEGRLDGVATDHVSGRLDKSLLVRAAAGSGAAASIGSGLSAEALRNGLAAADFDLYADRAGGDLRRLDLTVALDDPDNGGSPTRIRFSLAGESDPTE